MLSELSKPSGGQYKRLSPFCVNDIWVVGSRV